MTEVVLFVQFDGRAPEEEGARYDGASLGRSLEAVDDVARKLGARPLSTFLSASASGGATQEVHAAEVSPESWLGRHPLAWFDPDEGLESVSVLIPAIEGPLGDGCQDGTLDDLESLRHLLESAKRSGVRFHLVRDIC